MEAYTAEEMSTKITKIFNKIQKIEKLLKENKIKEKNQDELLTINKASKLVKLSVSTIYSKVCKNEIPVNKQGKRLYFYRKELLDWISAGRVKTVSEIQKEIDMK